jgi:hypothetical protein
MGSEPFSGLQTSLAVTFAAAAIAKTITDVFVSRRHDKDVQTIEAKVEREPEKARFAWDLARVKLEAYFDRNLVQVNAIFWVSVSVMIVGFGLIGYGIAAALQTPNALTPAVVGAASVVITEFIGATFMHKAAVYGKLVATCWQVQYGQRRLLIWQRRRYANHQRAPGSLHELPYEAANGEELCVIHAADDATDNGCQYPRRS